MLQNMIVFLWRRIFHNVKLRNYDLHIISLRWKHEVGDLRIIHMGNKVCIQDFCQAP
jgi:hypothetical protein